MRTSELDVAKAYIAKGKYGFAFGVMVVRLIGYAVFCVCGSAALPATITAASTAWERFTPPSRQSRVPSSPVQARPATERPERHH